MSVSRIFRWISVEISLLTIVLFSIAAYTATQIRPSPSSTQSSSSGSHSSPGPIIGGAIGGVLAAFLLGFLVYLWRRDKAQRRRSEGAPVQKVKKAEGKFAIEDEPRYAGFGAGQAPGSGEGGWAGPAGGIMAVGREGGGGGDQGGYGRGHQDPYANYDDGYGAYRPNSGSDESYKNGYGNSNYRPASYAAPAPPPAHHQQPPSRASQSRPYGHSATSPSSYNYPASSPYESGGTMTSSNRSYPYHEQGFGTESRRYPVPEI